MWSSAKYPNSHSGKSTLPYPSSNQSSTPHAPSNPDTNNHNYLSNDPAHTFAAIPASEPMSHTDAAQRYLDKKETLIAAYRALHPTLRAIIPAPEGFVNGESAPVPIVEEEEPQSDFYNDSQIRERVVKSRARLDLIKDGGPAAGIPTPVIPAAQPRSYYKGMPNLLARKLFQPSMTPSADAEVSHDAGEPTTSADVEVSHTGGGTVVPPILPSQIPRWTPRPGSRHCEEQCRASDKAQRSPEIMFSSDRSIDDGIAELDFKDRRSAYPSRRAPRGLNSGYHRGRGYAGPRRPLSLTMETFGKDNDSLQADDPPLGTRERIHMHGWSKGYGMGLKIGRERVIEELADFFGGQKLRLIVLGLAFLAYGFSCDTWKDAGLHVLLGLNFLAHAGE